MVFRIIYEKGLFKLTWDNLNDAKYFAAVDGKYQELTRRDLGELDAAILKHLTSRTYYEAREKALRGKSSG